MPAPLLSVSRRTRSTPFTRRVTAAGIQGYTVYNRTLLPTFFEGVEEDYHHLKRHVQVWDVTCERQVEVKGPDAAALMQKLTPRSLAKMKIGQCYYVPMVDDSGGMLNDPVALKLAEGRYWVSIADSDLLLWIKGLAIGFGMDVSVEEPDVSPLAVQGPKAEDVMAEVFGEAVRDIRFFRFARLPFMGMEFVVSRSGYSKQGGFEIYLEGFENGEILWDALFEAGQAFDVRPGGPNLIERIEGGLLSYGNDMTRQNTPQECGLGKFCDEEVMQHCIGGKALLRRAAVGPHKQIRGVLIAGDRVPPCTKPWPIYCGSQWVGQVTSAVWSPDFRGNVALGMIAESHWGAGTEVEVEVDAGDGRRPAEVRALPFG